MGAKRRARRKLGRRFPERASYRDLERALKAANSHIFDNLIPELEEKDTRIQLLEGIIDAYENEPTDAEVAG